VQPRSNSSHEGAPVVRWDARPAPGDKFARPFLDVLAQDKFQTEPLTGMPSARPQGWLRADPRWVDPLLALRSGKDSNLAWPASSALAHADLELVLSKLPQPKKKLPPLTLEKLGTLAFAPSAYRRDPVWLGAARIVIADTKTTLAAHALEPGLPRLASFALPAGVALPDRRGNPNDNAWEVPGLYDVAIRADGGVAVGAQTSDPARPHVQLIALYEPSGALAKRVELPDSGPVFPHAMVFGTGGSGALWVALDEENVDMVVAFDPATLARLGTVKLGATFPPPAWFEPVQHPREDVGVFAIACGQDGAWLKVVERSPTFALRKQKLNAKQPEVGLLGFSDDGAMAAFATGSTLVLRPWPGLDALKKKRLGGTVMAGGVVDGAVAIVLAEVSHAPSAIVLHRFSDGEAIAKGRFPLGETFVGLGQGVLVTRDAAGSPQVWRVRAAT
jgi:hypothetical protein